MNKIKSEEPYQIETCSISGVKKIYPLVHVDSRGYLEEVFNHITFPEKFAIAQINYVVSEQKVLRGMHYQIGKPQAKIIQLIDGMIFDVVVDVRIGSPTFGKWETFYLQKDDELLYVPPGCAHGFYSLIYSKVMYYMSDIYRPEQERSFIWDDLKIRWPLIGDPVLSAKDAVAPKFADAAYFAE